MRRKLKCGELSLPKLASQSCLSTYALLLCFFAALQLCVKYDGSDGMMSKWKCPAKPVVRYALWGYAVLPVSQSPVGDSQANNDKINELQWADCLVADYTG